MPSRVEDPVHLQLEGVSGLKRSKGGEEPSAPAGDRTGEVGGASVKGEVFAPGTALMERFFSEEEFRGGGKLVKSLDWDVKVLVRVVETGIGRLVRVGSVIAHRLSH